MQLLSRLSAAALVAGALLVPASAQVKVFGGVDGDRSGSTVIMFDEGTRTVIGGASISFSAPQWKDEYNDLDGMIEKLALKGKNARLGKNWWTSLDTTVALEIGGTKVAPGAYHLGLHCDTDGKFHLLVMDAGKSAKNGWMPFITDAWKPEYRIPLELKKDALTESTVKMKIELTSDPKDPSSGAFAIRWGKHELGAPVKFTVPAAKGKGAEDATGGKAAPAKK